MNLAWISVDSYMRRPITPSLGCGPTLLYAKLQGRRVVAPLGTDLPDLREGDEVCTVLSADYFSYH